MTSLDTDFSSEEESDDGSDIETVPMETITGDDENEEVKPTENLMSDTMEPVMAGMQQNLKSPATVKSPAKPDAPQKTNASAAPEVEPEVEPVVDLENEVAPEFTTAEEVVETKTYEELYNSKSNQELVSNLKDRSDIIKESVKLLLIGVSPEYIKFEPTRDVFGFLMSKDQKERTSIFQTQTCNASIQHINVPSLNTKLTVEENKYDEIFSTAVNEENLMNLVESLKANNSIAFENKNPLTTANTSIAPFTPFLEIMLTEIKDDNGYVAVLAGDKLVNTFNFLRCKTLHLDDSAPKKIYLSSVLESLAESGAKNIVIVNLSSNTGSTMNMMATGPSTEPNATMKEMESNSDFDSGSEDEDASVGTEAEVPAEAEEPKEVEPEAEEPNEVEMEETEEAKVEEATEPEVEEVKEAEVEEPKEAEVKEGEVEETKEAEEKPPRLTIGEVIPKVGGKKTKKNLQLKLKSILKKTRSNK